MNRRNDLKVFAGLVVWVACVWMIICVGRGPVPRPINGRATGARPTKATTGAARVVGAAQVRALQPGWEAEVDPFRRCAMKALAGEFGPLEEWQQVGYQLGLEQGTLCDTLIWGTPFYPAEGYDYGEITRSGYPCSLRVAASNTVPGGEGPPHWFVWTERSGIRQVLDTGASWNDAVARQRGAELWVDMWVWEEKDYATGVYRAAVISR